jgi:hypothetical protein
MQAERMLKKLASIYYCGALAGPGSDMPERDMRLRSIFSRRSATIQVLLSCGK